MPAPKWFQKLRSRRRSKSNQQSESPCRSQAAGAAADTPAPAQQCPSPLPAPPPCAAVSVSPNRASYYFASAERQDRELPCAADGNAAALALVDVIRVDVVHRRAGHRRLGGLDAPPGTPELNNKLLLRPIVTTRPAIAAEEVSESGGRVSSASATTSAATTPSTTRARGFHVKPRTRRRRRRSRSRSERDYFISDDSVVAMKNGKAAAAAEEEQEQEEEEDLKGEVSPESASLRRVPTQRRRRWLYESVVVVKASTEPEREMAESMCEMVVANGIRAAEDLEELLACYLALNAAEHHRAVVAAFRHVWILLDRHRLLLI